MVDWWAPKQVIIAMSYQADTSCTQFTGQQSGKEQIVANWRTTFLFEMHFHSRCPSIRCSLQGPATPKTKEFTYGIEALLKLLERPLVISWDYGRLGSASLKDVYCY
jgi:hypothetical protein